MSVDASARTVMERCEILASYSEEPDRLTRRFATKAMQQVNETVMAWMHTAGMTVEQDNIGNLIGRYNSACIGSKFMAGTLDPEALHLTDTDGITMTDAIRSFGGDPNPDTLQIARWSHDELLGYCEVHIEQ